MDLKKKKSQGSGSHTACIKMFIVYMQMQLNSIKQSLCILYINVMTCVSKATMFEYTFWVQINFFIFCTSSSYFQKRWSVCLSLSISFYLSLCAGIPVLRAHFLSLHMSPIKMFKHI